MIEDETNESSSTPTGTPKAPKYRHRKLRGGVQHDEVCVHCHIFECVHCGEAFGQCLFGAPCDPAATCGMHLQEQYKAHTVAPSDPRRAHEVARRWPGLSPAFALVAEEEITDEDAGPAWVRCRCSGTARVPLGWEPGAYVWLECSWCGTTGPKGCTIAEAGLRWNIGRQNDRE